MKQADEKHVGIEGVFVWVIRAGGDPVSHDIIAAAKPSLLLAVLSVRVCARSIGLQRYPPIPRITHLLTRKRRVEPIGCWWLMSHWTTCSV